MVLELPQHLGERLDAGRGVDVGGAVRLEVEVVGRRRADEALVPVDRAPERGVRRDVAVQLLVGPGEERRDLGVLVPRLRRAQLLAVLVRVRLLLVRVVHQVAAVVERLRVVVERDRIGPAVVLREQVDGVLAAGEAELRVAPRRLVLGHVGVERLQQLRLGEVAHLLDRERHRVERLVARRGVARVRRVLVGRRRDRELDLDAGFLEELRDDRERALGERLLELRLGEVERLDDDRVRRGAGLLHGAQGRDRAPFLGVERVLVALGALESGRAAVHARGEAAREPALAARERGSAASCRRDAGHAQQRARSDRRTRHQLPAANAADSS